MNGLDAGKAPHYIGVAHRVDFILFYLNDCRNFVICNNEWNYLNFVNKDKGGRNCI